MLMALVIISIIEIVAGTIDAYMEAFKVAIDYFNEYVLFYVAIVVAMIIIDRINHRCITRKIIKMIY